MSDCCLKGKQQKCIFFAPPILFSITQEFAGIYIGHNHPTTITHQTIILHSFNIHPILIWHSSNTHPTTYAPRFRHSSNTNPPLIHHSSDFHPTLIWCSFNTQYQATIFCSPVHCSTHFSWAAMTALASANFFSASRLASDNIIIIVWYGNYGMVII